MTRIKAAAAVLNQTPMDWDGNKQNILAAIEAARRESASLLCLPELCICGYGCEDAFASESLPRISLEVLQEILPETEGLVVSLGLPLLHRNRLYNTVCLAVDGRIAGFAAKRFLAGDGLHYEPRWFRPWPEDVCDTIRIGGDEYSIGAMLFDCSGVKLGFEICEEAWVLNRPAGRMSVEGVDIILNPSASHFAFAKSETRKRLVVEGSRAFGVGYVFANLMGNEAGRAIYDGGALLASTGELLAEGPRLSFAPVNVTSAVIDSDAARMARARSSNFRNTASENKDAVKKRPFRAKIRGSQLRFRLAQHRAANALPGYAELANGRPCQGRRICPRGRTGAFRLSAQKPLAWVRGEPQRRRRFV